jgi:hypothetical protein
MESSAQCLRGRAIRAGQALPDQTDDDFVGTTARIC